MYEEIASNKRRSVILILVFVLLLAALGYFFGEFSGLGWWGLIIALILALALTFSSYYYSHILVLKATRAQPAKKEEYPHLVNSIEGLSIAAGIPQPDLYIINDPSPNAFATGRDPEHGVVAVTTGLIDRLDRLEIEGVLAHEIAHIRNYDTRIATLAAVMVGSVIILSTWLRRSFFFYGRGRSSSRKGGGAGAIIIIVALLLSILAPIFAQLIRLAISRRREYLADADGSLITRYPEGLARALEKISQDPRELQDASQAMAHLFIINPFRGKTVSRLFSTHPPLEERVKILRRM